MVFLIWCISKVEGSRDGGVVRALAPHQCDPASIPDVHAICGLSLLLVLVPAPRFFSPGTPVFLPPQTTNIPKFQFDLETVDERATLWKPLQFSFSYNFQSVIGSAVSSLISRYTIVARDTCFQGVFPYFCNVFSLQVHLGSSSLPWRLIDLLSKRQPLSIAYLRSYLAPP